MVHLSERLKEKLFERGISAHRLELEAGLKRSAVQNILQGRSRKPSAEILHAIAKILNCSIADLLGEKQTSQLLSKKESKMNCSLQFDLYREAVKTAENVLRNKSTSLNKTKVLDYIHELYQYAIENKASTIDIHFAQWLANRWWQNEL